MPTRLTHAGVAIDGHDIYLVGGYTGIGDTGYNQTFGVTTVWKYNIDTKTYTSIKAMPKAMAGGGAVVASGTPEDVAVNPESYTGHFLAEILDVPRPKPKRRSSRKVSA
jgi:excinuclease ABC subunit A